MRLFSLLEHRTESTWVHLETVFFSGLLESPSEYSILIPFGRAERGPSWPIITITNGLTRL